MRLSSVQLGAEPQYSCGHSHAAADGSPAGRLSATGGERTSKFGWAQHHIGEGLADVGSPIASQRMFSTD